MTVPMMCCGNRVAATGNENPMKIIVAIKRVIDYNIKIRIKADGTGVETANDDVTLLLAAAEWFTKCRAAAPAVELLQRAVVLQPENVVAANNLAMLLADSNRDFDLAIDNGVLAIDMAGPHGLVWDLCEAAGWPR